MHVRPAGVCKVRDGGLQEVGRQQLVSAHVCFLCPVRTNERFLSTPLRCMLAVEVAFFAESTAQRTFTMEQSGECVQATWMGMHRCFLSSLHLGIF